MPVSYTHLRYARKLKKKAKTQGKKGTKTARSSAQNPTSAQDAGASSTGEGGSNWLSRWRQKQDIRQSYYAAARSGTAAQTAGGKAASNGASAARSGMEMCIRDSLYSHVLRKIRECARAALMDGEAVADRLTNTCEAEQQEQREAMERSLTGDEERIEVLDKMIMRLYEDMIAGRISEQNFNTMLERTQTEQTELKTKVSEGRIYIFRRMVIFFRWQGISEFYNIIFDLRQYFPRICYSVKNS